VLGASGYTGAEVVRLSALHPHIQITALTGEKQAGKVGVRCSRVAVGAAQPSEPACLPAAQRPAAGPATRRCLPGRA
jgi:N-acetyl-gamma-glutamylphosphate reductase